MGQKQTHRGKHPEDARLFSAKWIPALRAAVADLSYLLSRDYATQSALKIVGDHFQLQMRQRRAVERAACSDASLEYRKTHEVAAESLAVSNLCIDGYNLLISVESALARGILLRGRDGCIRDMASIHGSYHRVEETLPAIRLIGRILQELGVCGVKWYFDAPVSNSARLKTLLCHEAGECGWNWQVELENNPDRLIAASGDVVVTGDSWILDRAGRWSNLMDIVVKQLGLESCVINTCP